MSIVVQKTISIVHCPQCETDLKIVENHIPLMLQSEERGAIVCKWWIHPKYIKTKPKPAVEYQLTATVFVAMFLLNVNRSNALICFLCM